jgi:hypothetical protein
MHKFLNYIINKIFIVFNGIGLKKGSAYDDLQFKGAIESLPSISVVIPIIEKDLEILRVNVINFRKYCQNPIAEIYVVSPVSKLIEDECVMLKLKWVDEALIAPVSKDEILFRLGDPFRVNWFYQQFLKLSFDKIVSTKHYLVLDADTILLSPQYFVDNQKMILKMSDEFHYLYQLTNKRLIPELKIKLKSFITHHQLIQVEILQQLKKKISNGNDKELWQKILVTTKNNSNWFSEYELYGHFVRHFYPSLITIVYWHNKNLYRKQFSEKILESYSRRYASISFHNYNYQIYKEHQVKPRVKF